MFCFFFLAGGCSCVVPSRCVICQSKMAPGFVKKPLRMADLWQQAALDAKEIMEPMESTEAEDARLDGIPPRMVELPT